jgi:hypothetical protein
MATHIRMDDHPYQAAFPNRELILFFTAASIVIRSDKTLLHLQQSFALNYFRNPVRFSA